MHGSAELCVHEYDLVAQRTQPLPMDYNPRSVFERLFGDSGARSGQRGQRGYGSRAAFWTPCGKS